MSNTSCCNVASLGGLCLPNSKLCKNRTEFVFWDAFHPSDAANAVLADRIFSTVFSQSHSPSPAPSSGGRPHHPHHWPTTNNPLYNFIYIYYINREFAPPMKRSGFIHPFNVFPTLVKLTYISAWFHILSDPNKILE